MNYILRFFLSSQLKISKLTQPRGGFTLLELLVAMILAVLVITPLLGFMVNYLDTDRREQAKSTSEQELQAAMEYITRDLDQAVYIYDDSALINTTTGTDPTADPNPGIQDQIPPIAPTSGCTSASNCQPVLVFWKRTLIPKEVPVDDATDCFTASETVKEKKCNDGFVYSLVGYYLIKEDNQTWSKTARIGRWEIKDSVKKLDGKPVDETADDATAANSRITRRSKGFKPFDLTISGNLATKMKTWKKEASENYYQSVQTLVDYIDQSNISSNPDSNSDKKLLRENCPAADPAKAPDPQWRQVPQYPGGSEFFQTYSFYACVYSSKNTARVFLRGNALARLKNSNEDPPNYNTGTSTFFPTSRIEVTSRGGLGTESK